VHAGSATDLTACEV